MTKEKKKVYFGVEERVKYYLPETEEEQWIEHKKLKEGERRQYEDSSQKRISMNTQTNMVEMDMALGADRQSLFDAAVVAFKILRNENGEDVEVTDMSRWPEIRDEMPGDISQSLLESIRELNPWLQPDEEVKKK